jgi:hypothetical protein
MSTTAAPDCARRIRSALFVAIRADVIPSARTQTMPDELSSVIKESTALREQERTGLTASVDLHVV